MRSFKPRVGYGHKPYKYAPASQQESAEATSVATSSHQDLHMSSSIPATTGWKSTGSHSDPERDDRKRQRRMGSLVEEALQTPTSYMPLDTHDTSLDTGVDHGGDVSGESSPHETGCYPALRATPAEAGVSTQAHADLVLEVNRLR